MCAHVLVYVYTYLHNTGNSAQSFIQSFTLLHTAFTVQIATPGGKSLEFTNQDEQSRRWLNDFRMKTFAVPLSLHTIDQPMCAVGMGVVGLFPAVEDGDSWSFKRFTLTSVSVFELARDPDFATLPIIPEDILKDRGALYSSSEPDEVHVVVDRHLITGQNEQSTLTAVQNLILLCNHKQSRRDKL
ncbi:glutamine amidotransferase-like class 1 domain-containing protein 1 isoform X2 [Limulus polyphemus]|uniref:Glutamine amidotransferase-like class 1 domain-containing protein 1 n=1 Tax=Limulus polyphemus TaxID=6850 RepID=A0ABM1SS06_LIMPO|nr:glutamine amidotransferase-like class 1 domain-containing protein 1 isoform X2 [Limulus polyphemus]